MKPFWHPLSTLLLADPPCLASPHALGLMLRAAASVDLIYAGDRMEPAVAHGARIAVESVDPHTIAAGDVVLVARERIPDLLRVLRRDARRLWLGADADPETFPPLPVDALLARARLPARRVSPASRLLRRWLLELREARTPLPTRVLEDPAATVRQKYDLQAAFYARSPAADLESSLRARILERVPARGRMLVVGSGSGKECFALAQAGRRVTGIDFAPAMVESARREAERRGIPVEFVEADLREFDTPRGSLAGVLFTYDVYSFVPGRAARVHALRRIRDWLAPQAPVFLSARTLHAAYERFILTVQRLARSRRPGAEWGDSHTRWIAADGSLNRSFVRYFSDAQLRHEIESAGFRIAEWRDAHGMLL